MLDCSRPHGAGAELKQAIFYIPRAQIYKFSSANLNSSFDYCQIYGKSKRVYGANWHTSKRKKENVLSLSVRKSGKPWHDWRPVCLYHCFSDTIGAIDCLCYLEFKDIDCSTTKLVGLAGSSICTGFMGATMVRQESKPAALPQLRWRLSSNNCHSLGAPLRAGAGCTRAPRRRDPCHSHGKTSKNPDIVEIVKCQMQVKTQLCYQCKRYSLVEIRQLGQLHTSHDIALITR